MTFSGIKANLLLIFLVFVINGCEKNGSENPSKCDSNYAIKTIDYRNFHMGFTTWSFGPNWEDRDETYQFISDNADIYSEQFDNKIAWKAWINNTELPIEFIEDVAYRVSHKPKTHKTLLSVSLLNSERNDLLHDYDGTLPSYNSFSDKIIEDAYFKHLNYLIVELNPDYVVLAMEVNELLINSETKWSGYKQLINAVRNRIKLAYPHILLSESVTLHNWFNPDVDDKVNYIKTINDYVNELDFVAVSFYPFFKGQHSKTDFQQTFDFLHAQVKKPIAFVETSHLAENLAVESYNLKINSSVCEQNEYLETLLLNAYKNKYQFVIWWAFRDFDALWSTFPDDVKDLGKLWRDTGLISETGEERPAFQTWSDVLVKQPSNIP